MSRPSHNLRANLEIEQARHHPDADPEACINMAYGALSYLAVQCAQGNEWAIGEIKRLAEIEVHA